MFSVQHRRPSVFLVALLLLGGCEYKDSPANSTVIPDCSASTLSLALTSKTDPTSCNLIDGSIIVTAMRGVPPYAYSINGGAAKSSNGFSNLAPGIYTMVVADATGCSQMIQVELTAPGSDLAAVTNIVSDTDCLIGNGSITITGTGGASPYQYQFNTGEFSSANSFTALKSGYYSITVKDANGCPKTLSIIVPRGDTGVSYVTEIKPIITNSCAIDGCHNGDNGASRNWTVLANLQKNAQNVKTRTGNKSMPLTGHLTDKEIALIACWVDDGAKDN